jgi:cell division protein FtsI/penicillin-binding protein 2
MPRAAGFVLLACAALSLALEAAAATPRRHATRRRPVPPPQMVLPASASARDLEVGEAARQALKGLAGAVVAMDPHTGRVITAINPGLGVSRAFQPCSVFKIVVAVAGLSEGVLTPQTTYECQRGCWLWPGHGTIDLRRALAVSCNPFFEWVGERLGYPTLQRYAQRLGLGSPTGMNLPGETPGILPSAVAPAAVGHLSSHAAGVTTSAVQVAVMLSAMVNGGIVFQPQLAGPGAFQPRERWRLPPQTPLAQLTDGFLSAVNEGSAAAAFDAEVPVAGKTGTCSGVGWLASYAPADRPELVLVVVVKPGSGHLASVVSSRIYQGLYKPAAVVTATGG